MLSLRRLLRLQLRKGGETFRGIPGASSTVHTLALAHWHLEKLLQGHIADLELSVAQRTVCHHCFAEWWLSALNHHDCMASFALLTS